MRELEVSNQKLLEKLGGLRALAGAGAQSPGGIVPLLRIALANEISVAELAPMWMPAAADWDIKITLAQQAGKEQSSIPSKHI